MRQTIVAHGDMAKTINVSCQLIESSNSTILKWQLEPSVSIFLPIVQKRITIFDSSSHYYTKNCCFIAGFLGYELPKLHEAFTFDYDDGILEDI